MEHNRLWGLLALAVLIIGLAAYLLLHPAPAKAPTGGEAASSTPAMTLSGTKYEEHAAYYDIVANYASSTELSEPGNTAAIALMKTWVGDEIAQFKKDGNFANLTPDDVHLLGLDSGRKYKFQVTYLIGSSGSTLSYIFTVYEDTGGAHGNTFFKTFVFDKKTGALLSLSDLFTPGSDYLGTLSQMARSNLPKVIGEKFADYTQIKDGTTPEEKNFANFFFDGTDFVVLFPPYQVAAYAAGPQTLRMPTSQLYSILKTSYR